jgi:thiol-disulfide isomerase/thioredoxin
MKIFKFLALALISLSILSCSSEKKDAKTPETGTTTEVKKETSISSAVKVYPSVSAEKPVGKLAADFTWNENGKTVKFSEFTKGKYVLLNFWGTWCPPCRRELPDLVAISKEMESKNLVVLGVALEQVQTMNEAVNVVSNFWTKNGLSYPIVIGSGELAEAYGGIEAVPSTFLINTKGEIVQKIVGGRDKAGFMAELSKMMK